MPRPRVLIYSQQPRHLSGILSTLAQEGFEVSGTTSEAEALDKFRAGNYDMLLYGLPAASDQGAPGTLVVLRLGGTVLAIPSLVSQPLMSLEGRPDGVRFAVGQARASREALETELLSPLLRVVGPLAQEERAEAVLPRLVEALAQLTTSGAWLLVPQGGGSELAVRCVHGGTNLGQPLALRLARRCMEKREPLLLLDPATAPAEWRQELSAASTAGGFCLPLLLGQKTPGALAFLRGASASRLTNQHVQLATLFQPLLALLVEQERREKETRESQASVTEMQENLERRLREVRALNTLLQNQQARLLEIEDSLRSLGQRYTAALRTLVNLIETGDPARAGPSEAAANWMLALARPLGVPPDGLAEAAYLHDLGMPRPTVRAALSTSEQQQLLRHPFLAEQIAESLGLPLEVRLALKHHHESFDGSGYPDGLSGDSIPLRARILRVADALVALISLPDRPLSSQEAVVRVKGGAGKEYDPKVIEALGQLVTESSGGRETEMISTVSHELRSPLVFLVGYSELLAAQKDLPEDAREKAKEIYQEAVHMSSLVEDLLNVSRYESGRVEFHWQDGVDLGELMKRAVTKARTRTSEHRLELRLPPQGLRIRTDPDKLGQVLDNLMDNAIKYSPNGGQITLSGERRDGEVWLSVSDEGIGIPEEKQTHLFEKFYRVDTPLKDKVAGTGLGLNIAQHIAKGHGGRIWVESAEGKGSTFTVALPA